MAMHLIVNDVSGTQATNDIHTTLTQDTNALLTEMRDEMLIPSIPVPVDTLKQLVSKNQVSLASLADELTGEPGPATVKQTIADISTKTSTVVNAISGPVGTNSKLDTLDIKMANVVANTLATNNNIIAYLKPKTSTPPLLSKMLNANPPEVTTAADALVTLVTLDGNLSQTYRPIADLLALGLFNESTGTQDLTKPKLDEIYNATDRIGIKVDQNIDSPLSTVVGRLDDLKLSAEIGNSFLESINTHSMQQSDALLAKLDVVLSRLEIIADALYGKLPYVSAVDDQGDRKLSTSFPIPLASLLARALFSVTPKYCSVEPNGLLIEYSHQPYLSAFALLNNTPYPTSGTLNYPSDQTIVSAPYIGTDVQLATTADFPLVDGQFTDPFQLLDAGLTFPAGYNTYVPTSRYVVPPPP